MLPLMWAANIKQHKIAEELARRGADVYRKDPENGWTAMDYAENNNKYALAARLHAIGEDQKAQAVQRALDAANRLEQQKAAAAKADFDAACMEGLPIKERMKAMC